MGMLSSVARGDPRAYTVAYIHLSLCRSAQEEKTGKTRSKLPHCIVFVIYFFLTVVP